MATANNAYGIDPTDPYNQVRQRMLGQQYQDPSVDLNTSTVPSSDAASPDFAPTPASGSAAGIQSPIFTSNGGSDIQAGTGEAPAAPTAPAAMPTSFTNTSTVKASTPTGVADPTHPGYDTAGFVLGSHYDPQGNLIIANPTTGKTATTPAGTLNTSFAPTPAAAAAPPPAPGAGPGGVSAAPSAFTNQLRDLILSRLQSLQGPVDPNNPEISSTLGAARDEASRASDQERTALAEHLYAQNLGSGGAGGLGSNAITQQIQQSGERNAGALSTLRGQLLMNEYNQKNTQLQNLLSLAVQSGDSESARAVQAQIANLQAAINREGLGINLAEFGQQLNQNAAIYGLNG